MPGLEAFNHVRNVKPGPGRSEGPLTAASQTIGRELEALPIFQGANREPDRSEGSGRALNLKHPTSVGSVSANPNEVRVQRRAPVQCVSANPNGVRVRGANVPPAPELFSFFWYSLERKLVSLILKGQSPAWTI